MLTERQEEILRCVVDEHLESGKPVGSKAIAGRRDVEWSASTVRSEFAALEESGLLTHPHTSAGRLPTDSGYRSYVEALLAAEPRSTGAGVELELSRMRREVDDAMRETTTALSSMTDLVALVTAPPLDTATIHRVEALRLQPNVVMVVVISSAGAVTKRTFTFDDAVDPGLVEWASQYLNERLSGLGLGARMIDGRLSDPELGRAEQRFLDSIRSAFSSLEGAGEQQLYMEGAARLLSESHFGDLPDIDRLMRALERRASVLAMLRSALDERSVFLWIGGENPQPELRSVSVVGANYGLGYRNLGSVGVVGPLRMDYATAIVSVRDAARQLSRYFESVYE
ncbi:MAG: heat-inducible transcriptional repressor HrcA [Solirubrobacterales bacterium]